MYTGELITCCNLYKGDLNYTRGKVIKFWNSQFYLMDLGTGFSCKETDMLDYTLMDDAALFQESLVFDKKYICTFEEVIAIQNEMKEYDSLNKGNVSINQEYKFNIGIPE